MFRMIKNAPTLFKYIAGGAAVGAAAGGVLLATSPKEHTKTDGEKVKNPPWNSSEIGFVTLITSGWGAEGGAALYAAKTHPVLFGLAATAALIYNINKSDHKAEVQKSRRP